MRSPDNTPPTRTRPGLQPPNVCVLFPPRQRERIRVRSSRALHSPDNSRHCGRPPACCHAGVCNLLSPRRHERTRARSSHTLRSPDNPHYRRRPRAYSHQTDALSSSSPTRALPGSQLASAAVTWQLPPPRAPPGLQPPSGCAPFLLANASASGFADRIRRDHSATPATAGAPGLTATKRLRSLPPRQRERLRARSSRTLRSPDNSRHRGHLRDRGSHELLPLDNSRHRGRPRATTIAELHPRFTPCSTEPFNSRAGVPSGTKSAERHCV
jgi:hypothetical protein